MNDSNKGGQPPAESREGSNRAKENVQRPRTDRAQQRAAVSQWLEGVRQAARRKATGRFTSEGASAQQLHLAVASSHAGASAQQLLRLKEAGGGRSRRSELA